MKPLTRSRDAHCPVSLDNPYIATMEADNGAYNQTDATGFIRLNALRLRTRAGLKKKWK